MSPRFFANCRFAAWRSGSWRKIESGGEKVESRNSQKREYLHGFSAVELPSYLLPSTRSTFYFLLSRLFWLLVYQKSVDFADSICATTEGFQRGYGFLVDQLNRAELSISSNIAEGNGRFTIPDRRHFFGIARGSVQECVPQLEIAKRRGLISESYLWRNVERYLRI